MKRHLGGDINLLQFEPSDLTIDEKKGLLLVASLNEIIAIPDGLSTSKEDAKILYRSQNGENDFEAIEIIDEVVYAVSEASQINNRSDVVVFGAEAEGRIVPTSRYNTNTPMVEGMAYISSPNWFPQPRLVLAGLASDHSLRMNTYDFPLPGNSPVENPVTLTSTGLNTIYSVGTWAVGTWACRHDKRLQRCSTSMDCFAFSLTTQCSFAHLIQMAT